MFTNIVAVFEKQHTFTMIVRFSSWHLLFSVTLALDTCICIMGTVSSAECGTVHIVMFFFVNVPNCVL